MLVLLSTRDGYAAVVSKIVFHGLQRIEPITAEHKLGISVGDDVDRFTINKALKRLYSTEYFSNIDMDITKNGILVINVTENPVVNEIIMGGISSKIGDIIKQELSLKSRSSYTKEKAKSDSERIRLAFHKAGKVSAVVSPKIEQLDRNRVNVLFDIKDNKPSRVSSILFLNNLHFSDKKLSGVLTNRPRTPVFGTFRGKVFEEDSLDIDKSAIIASYVNNGFVNAAVDVILAEYDKENTDFILTFDVNEGNRYVFGNITVESDVRGVDISFISPSSLHTITGDIYKQNKINKSIIDLTRDLANHGYAFVSVEPVLEKNVKTLTVNIKFVIKEAKTAYIGKISTYGNTRSFEKTILNEMLVQEGDLYNKNLIERSKRRLQILGYFDLVEIKEKKTDRKDRIDLDIIVQDRKQTGSLSGSIGYSTFEFLILNLSISKANLFGRGIGFQTSVLASGWRRQISTGLSKSHIFGTNATLGIDITYTNINPLNISVLSLLPPYIQNSVATSIRFTYPITDELSQSWSLQYRYDNIGFKSNTALGSSRIFNSQVSNVAMSTAISHSLYYDHRDNPVLPTRGLFLQLTNTIGLPLPYQVQYVSNDFFGGVYIPIVNDSWVFSILGRAGAIVDYNGGHVPFQYRHPLGYYDFVGFSFAGVGPHVAFDTFDPTTGSTTTSFFQSGLRGLYYWVVSFEMRMPTPLPKSYGLNLIAFIDVGSSFGVPSNLPTSPGGSGATCNGDPFCTVNANGTVTREYVVDTPLPRMSVGAGLLWMSGMGPIRLEFAYAAVRQEYDNPLVVRLHFSALPI